MMSMQLSSVSNLARRRLPGPAKRCPVSRAAQIAMLADQPPATQEPQQASPSSGSNFYAEEDVTSAVTATEAPHQEALASSSSPKPEGPPPSDPSALDAPFPGGPGLGTDFQADKAATSAGDAAAGPLQDALASSGRPAEAAASSVRSAVDALNPDGLASSGGAAVKTAVTSAGNAADALTGAGVDSASSPSLLYVGLGIAGAPSFEL